MTYDVADYAVENGVKTVSYVSRVNFMYVVDPPVEGLPFLNKDQGWLVYFLRLAATGILAVTLCYIKPILKGIAGTFRKEKKEA